MAGQVWETSSLGGYMYSDELSDVLRHALQPMIRFRQHCDAKDATDKGLNRGDAFNWNIYSDVATRGGDLNERDTMPETNFTITQGTLTVTESGNSVPYSGKLDDLSKQPVSEIVHKVMKHDATKALDAKAHAQFNATPLTVAPASGTSTTAVTLETTGCTITNNVAMRSAHIKAIVDIMKERDIGGFDGDDYRCLGWPTTFRTMKNDLEAVHQYVDEGFKMILNGEIGRYEGVRFMDQTNIAKGGAVDSTTWTATTADAWDNGLSDWAFFFGEDTVAEGIAIPEEIRGKIPSDYGRSKGVAWYYLGGFGLVHSAAAQARIIKWESAA
jgi:N4-gp56 family major capsid protein